MDVKHCRLWGILKTYNPSDFYMVSSRLKVLHFAAEANFKANVFFKKFDPDAVKIG